MALTMDSPKRIEWFSGPGLQHPLADIDAARALVARHAAGDSVSVLDRISAWIEELEQIEGLDLAHRFEVLDLFDQHAKNHQINLIPEALETARVRKLGESPLWTTSFGFWKTLGDAYLRCLDQYQRTPSPSAAFEPQLPVLVGRILRSLTLQLKWTLLRHGKVGETLWRDLGRAYLFAETHEFSNRRVAVYQSRHGESSAREELLKMLMLAVSSPDALDPAQQHIAERIIAHFGDRFVLCPLPTEGCVFSFDLATGVAPSRTQSHGRPALLARHFGAGHVVMEAMAAIETNLSKTGALPPYFALTPRFSKSQIESVIAHLKRCWSDDAPTRQGKREDAATNLTVVPGLADSARWLNQMMSAGSPDVPPPASADLWQTSDASPQGFGAVLSGRAPEWLSVGALVGVRHESRKTCRMALIRRTQEDDAESKRVGLQLLGDAAAPCALFPLAATHASDEALPGEAAILLTSQPNSHGAVELLIRGDGIAAGKPVQMRFLNRLYRLDPLRTIESGRGFAWVECGLSRL